MDSTTTVPASKELESITIQTATNVLSSLSSVSASVSAISGLYNHANTHSHSHSHIAIAMAPHTHIFHISTYTTAIVQYLTKNVFIYGPLYNSIIAAILVHSTSLIFVSLLPLHNQTSNATGAAKGENLRMKMLLGFALGTVLGEVFLHLIPESDPAYLGTGLFIGLLTFLFIEKFINIITQGKHEHSHSNKIKAEKKTKTETVVSSSSSSSNSSKSGPPAYLTIITSLIHNTTDGITLATAFHHSTTTGTVTTLAFLVHEFPHLLSDYIIVLNTSGNTTTTSTSTKLGSLFKLCRSSVTAIIGASIGAILFYGTTTSTTTNSSTGNFDFRETLEAILLPFSAGGLLYMCAVNLLPEIVEDKNEDYGNGTTVLGLVLQLGAACVGFYTMYLLAE